MKRILRGVRNIPTMQGLRRNKREQLVTELAQLEHERARLERELKIWMRNQTNTAERLQQVEQRLDLLQQALNFSGDQLLPQQAEHSGTAPSSDLDVRDDDSKPPNWQNMSLEY
jgi:chromosome segregation ATPase